MARKMASFRLDVELLDWAKSYAESRGSTQATVIEAGLRSLRDASAAGVPDLPVVESPVVRRERAARAAGGQVAPASSYLTTGRQAHVNAMIARARAK